MKTFGPKHFRVRPVAEQYARQPERIANRVYWGRMGNGDEASGDGWRFRGRGLIQLTGRDNYTAFAKAVGMPLDDVPAYLETKDGAAMSAAWYWSSNGLNVLADTDQITAISRRVNGGDNGLEERKSLWRKALAAIPK